MNKLKVVKFFVIINILILSFVLPFHSIGNSNTRNIDIAGLIVNSQTFLPIESATIYDSENKILGATDKNGYFKIRINYTKSGPVNFKMKIAKEGYHDFNQHENWADIPGVIKTLMYFGLQGKNSTVNSFSNLANSAINSHNLTYNNVLINFNKVREQQEFNDKLEKAKSGNENVFLQIDNKLFIVDNTGWIQIGSEQDSISLNEKQKVTAKKLNSIIKRKDIKFMTPFISKTRNKEFAIYTIVSQANLNHI